MLFVPAHANAGSREWRDVYGAEPAPAEPVKGWSELMQRCWAENPDERPPFSDIAAQLVRMFAAGKQAKRQARAAAGKGAAAAAAAPRAPAAQSPAAPAGSSGEQRATPSKLG